MKQLTQNYKTGALRIEEVPLPLLRRGGVLVRNNYSVISAGTERATIEISQKGYIGKAKEKPEQFKKVINTARRLGLKKTYEMVMNKLNTPVPLGYSSAGQIIELGENAEGFSIGDRVACAGAGYAAHAEVIFVPKNLCAKIPEGVSLENASYATLGAIALQGVRQADVRLGENVVVLGLGLIGLLTVQILKAAGCVVIGMDIEDRAIQNAKKCGADHTIHLIKDDVSSVVGSITGEAGADAVIITAATKENKPVEMAGELCRKKGTVVVVGDVGMNIPRPLYYAKELDFKLSCSYGPGRYDPSYEEYGMDYPIEYVRWTEKRNMEAFLQLLKEKKVDPSKLTTHIFPFEEAMKAYEMVTGKSEEVFTGILLKYDVQKELDDVESIVEIRAEKLEKINIGLIGAGSFAQSMILPYLRDFPGVNLEAVLVAEGHMSQNIAKKFGVANCYSDPSSVFQNDLINTVIIATRHDMHARYIIEGLKHNKNIYVEKPLAVKEEDVKGVIEAHRQGRTDVLLGFNRRFAPLTEKCREFFSQRKSPMFMSYRINAGFIPKENWIQNLEEGGGRIIGEVCHFVDMCRFLCGEKFRTVFAQTLGGDPLRDNVAVMIGFQGGSLATIDYLACGNNAFPKERIEIFCQNSVAVIDDFKNLQLVRHGKVKSSGGSQDKGHKKQIHLWVESLKQGQPAPVPFGESVDATIATFMIHESLNTGKVVTFEEFSKQFF